MRILIVEDNEFNRDMLAKRLSRKGYTVSQAGNGRVGVEMARAELPSLILMDISLPEMDGCAATRAIKQDPATAQIPVVMLTAHAFDSDRERAFAAGCDDFETKPVILPRLMTKIEKYLGAAEEEAPAAPLVGPRLRRRSHALAEDAPHLLLVDDHALNRDMLQKRMIRKGFRVTTADSGDAALALIAAQPFDLVLLDYMMPGMSGLEVLKQIRLTRSASVLPVILVTAKDDANSIVEVLEAGANDHVSKPVNTAVLDARIRTQLSQRQTERALEISEERYALALRGANDGMWDWDLAGRRIFYSERWKTMCGDGTGIGESPDCWFSRIHPEDRARVEAELERHLEGTTPEFESEYRLLHQDGRYRWMLCRGLAVRDSSGQATRIAGSQTDITSNKVRDPLTQLPNRLAFEEKLEHAIQLRQRGRPDLLAVLFLDLDRFKMINDSLGHQAGDQFLVEISRRLSSAVRASDRVARLSFQDVFRFGGDEFGVFISGLNSAADAASIAKRLLQEISRPLELDGQRVFPSVSIGITVCTRADCSAAELLREADTALYVAKERGRAQYAEFDDEMRSQVVARLELETDLRSGLEHGQFELHYQPKIDLISYRVAGFEALVRWRHPFRGLLMPSEFISAAENNGLIVELGYWVTREACRQIADWVRRYPRRPPLRMSVNVSVRQLREPDFVERILEIVSEEGIPASCLELEVTESFMLESSELKVGALQRLKAAGVGLNLDDFGTGYSSLSYLQELPFDTLKIDRSFVSAMGDGGEGDEVLKSIVSLAKALRLDVVAEGVETAAQVEQLQGLMCQFGQGFFFAKPMNLPEAEHLLEMGDPSEASCQAASLPRESRAGQGQALSAMAGPRHGD